MKINNQSEMNAKSDYSALFLSALILLTVGLAMEGMATTPLYQFIEGVLIGMSIACSVIGFMVYARSRGKTH